MFGKYRPKGAFCALVLLLASLGLSLAACGTSSYGSSDVGTTPSAQASTIASAVFKVTSVDMAVSPASIDGMKCGTSITITYTATFHFPEHNSGGKVVFQYTTNNGRGSTPASLNVPQGQTTATYQFTWSGQLPADHTQPEPSGVMVTSPNALTSKLIEPTGSCTTAPTSAFKVTSIELSASPSLSGHACGTMFTETYTAIFHIAPNGPGGKIVFQYTTNNGRGSTDASLNVAAGQTSATYQFTWTGDLPADHTAPGTGIVLMSSPNQGQSPSASPAGSCS
jgi:hypothetical protein